MFCVTTPGTDMGSGSLALSSLLCGLVVLTVKYNMI